MERILPIIGDADVYAANNPFMAHNHIEITRIDREEDGDYRAEVRVVLRPESMNLHGAVHGGLLYGLADCVAGIAARCDGNDYVTQSAHVNFLRNTKQGVVYALARVVRRGRHMVVLHVAIRDAEDRLLADCAVDMMRMEA
jgi:acyl-CoA thioesterase